MYYPKYCQYWRECVPPLNKQLASGHITVVQEERFRLLTDGGQGLLLTLAHGAGADAADLARYLAEHAHVTVEYRGEPNLASGVALAVRPDAPPG
jgi:hypothetical protein